MNLLRGKAWEKYLTGSAQYYSQYDPIMNFIRIFCVLLMYVSTSGVSLLWGESVILYSSSGKEEKLL